MQVDSGEISNHTVKIIPTNIGLFDRNAHLGGKCCNLIFDITTIDN